MALKKLARSRSLDSAHLLTHSHREGGSSDDCGDRNHTKPPEQNERRQDKALEGVSARPEYPCVKH